MDARREVLIFFLSRLENRQSTQEILPYIFDRRKRKIETMNNKEDAQVSNAAARFATKSGVGGSVREVAVVANRYG